MSVSLAVAPDLIAAPWDLPLGAPVVDCTGEPVGRVVDADIETLTVRRGWFFAPSVAIPLAQVARVADGTVWLAVRRAELRE